MGIFSKYPIVYEDYSILKNYLVTDILNTVGLADIALPWDTVRFINVIEFNR